MTDTERERLIKHAVLFQHDAAACHALMKQNLDKRLILSAIYWQIASRDASRAAQQCVRAITDGR